MTALDDHELDGYRAEAKQRWGGTVAYQVFEEKEKTRSKAEGETLLAGMDALFEAFSICMKDHLSPESEATRKIVEKLQAYISQHFYPCTDEILAGLGQMYVADERFQKNIDRYAPGTAAYAGQAIAAYCRK